MDLSVHPDFFIGAILGAVLAVLVERIMDAQQRRAEKARIVQARSLRRDNQGETPRQSG